MIIYVIDERFPKGVKIPGKINKNYLLVKVKKTDTIHNVVQNMKKTIKNRKLGFRSLDLINLGGHGNSGYLQFGTGLTAYTSLNFIEMAPYLKSNQHKPGMHIHGCGVASDTSILGRRKNINTPQCIPGTYNMKGGKGYQLVAALAMYIKRPVMAGVNCQYADSKWKFEGATIKIYPNGTGFYNKR